MSEPVKKKKRTSLVCLNCKRKKIKCDRSQPCSQCVKVHKEGTCTYEDSALRANSAEVKQAPYRDSANRPMRFNIETSANRGVGPGNNSTGPSMAVYNNGLGSNGGTAAPVSKAVVHEKPASTTESELTFLRARLQLIEQSLEMSRQNNVPPYLEANYCNIQTGTQTGTQTSSGLSVLFPRENGPNATTKAESSTTNSIPSVGSTTTAYSPLFYPSALPGQATLPQPISNPPPTASNPPPTAPNPPAIASNPLPNQNFGTKQVPSQIFPNQSRQNQPTSSLSMGLPNNFSTKSASYGSFTSPSIHNNDINNYQSSLSSSIPNSIPSNGSDYSYTSSSLNSPETPGKKHFAGVNPFGSEDDTINFYEGYCTVHTKDYFQRLNFGPFCWSSLMQKDGALKILWDHCTRTREKSAKAAIVFSNKDITAEVTTLLTTDTKDSSLNFDETVFEKRSLETEGIDNLLPYYKKKKTMAEKDLQESQQNSQRLTLGLAFCDSKIETELRLIDKIQLFLPKKKVIWKLIKIFFSDVFPFTPFLEETCFRSEISRIIGKEEYKDEKIAEINIERRLDLAFIGILLIILRLSYISLFSNRNDINLSRMNECESSNSDSAKAYKYLLSNPITINSVSIAEECLHQFDLFRYPSFPILQLALFSKIYHTYAPEDGDGADGGGAAGMLAILNQMAASLGCNREPDNLPNFDHKSSRNNLSRRIWHVLVLNDIYLGYNFGNPIKINRGSYDTKIPFYKEGEECLEDKELDKFVNESLFSNAVLYIPVRNILHLTLNIEGRVKIPEVCKELSTFEVLLAKEYGDLSACLAPSDCKYSDFSISMCTKFYLSVKSFCCVIYFYLFLYYEPKNLELSFFYLRKILSVVVGELMPHYFELIGELKHAIAVNPSIEQSINTANHMLMSLVIRCNYIYRDLKNQDDHEERCKDPEYLKYFKTVCKLSTSLTRCLEVSVAVISKISNRYYYAWKITKGHTFMLKTISSNEFYDRNHEEGKPFCRSFYSVEQLLEIDSICEETLNKLGKDFSNFGLSLDPEGKLAKETKSNDINNNNDTNIARNGKDNNANTANLNNNNNNAYSNQQSETPAAEKNETAPKLYANSNSTPRDGNDSHVLHSSYSPDPNGDAVRYDLDFFNSSEIDKLWLQMFESGEQYEKQLDMFTTNIFDEALNNSI